jgi:hypothetical protein
VASDRIVIEKTIKTEPAMVISAVLLALSYNAPPCRKKKSGLTLSVDKTHRVGPLGLVEY